MHLCQRCSFKLSHDVSVKIVTMEYFYCILSIYKLIVGYSCMNVILLELLSISIFKNNKNCVYDMHRVHATVFRFVYIDYIWAQLDKICGVFAPKYSTAVSINSTTSRLMKLINLAADVVKNLCSLSNC